MELSGAFRSICASFRARDSEACQRFRRQLAVFLISTGIFLLVLTGAAYRRMHVEQQRLLGQYQDRTSLPGLIHESNVVLLSIPKIQLEAGILEGTGRKDLLLAPGHLEQTARPGDWGNSVIAGHRDTFFRRINELQQGDEILITRHGQQFHFAVKSKSIVNPEDIGVTLPSNDTRLTLITCYPTYYIGPAPKRLIVVATLLPDRNASWPGVSSPTRSQQ